MASAFMDIKVLPAVWLLNKFSAPIRPICNWCHKADGTYEVTRTSKLSDNTYTDFACDQCAKPWLESAD